MNLIATFYTHHGALMFSRTLGRESISFEMCPVPRALSTSCGTGVRFAEAGETLAKDSVDVEAVYRSMERGYDLVFRHEDEE